MNPILEVVPLNQLPSLVRQGRAAKPSDLVVTTGIRAKLDRVVAEQRARDRLSAHGLTPAWRLLLTGPPGTGKTLTASVLAAELELPIWVVRHEGVIASHLGETAANLSKVFDLLKRYRGVYLFDEFDALGSARGSSKDVGEMNRVVAAVLQFLEDGHGSGSVVVVATNHVALLDRALFRRFDACIEYGLPTAKAAVNVMRQALAKMDTELVDWQLCSRAAEGLSQSDIASACLTAAKDAVMDGLSCVETSALVRAFEDRTHGSKKRNGKASSEPEPLPKCAEVSR